MRKNILNTLLIFLSAQLFVSAQQLTIYRIDQMPNMPEPYLMLDWKTVAKGYDSLVFDFNSSGEYLPLIWMNTNTTNYPAHSSFGLHTVVGTTSPQSAEAINCLPAIISASLVGIDKSNQNGLNFALMAQEWFNNRPEQNVYKNHPVDDTYDDFWYITMPNVFFYQLYDFYPQTDDYPNQFVSVADQWLNAVKAMGASSTPWKIPNINHRGFDLTTMTPYSSGVKEPEAAGALAWILYNAYVETQVEEYRIGAEWCMEFLTGLSSNPSYELQLIYGAYIAARMNAELGTDYDVHKILGWCFDVGQLRNWGAVVGRWGSYDVSGLIGEVNGSNNYAFSMNTFEQVGALVPLVRYDDRFARAIGKWVLNAANASRLFYTKYLPNNKQDSEEWAHIHDPQSYIAHEAIRQEKYGQRPYATGDAIDGGWGATNLTLYSSSHAGILGGIIDTTNIPGILKLDLLKTDYFHDAAFPTFMVYNPHGSAHQVEIETGVGTFDIYNAVSNSMLINNVSGSANISIPADEALILVIIPSGGTITYQLNQTLVNGTVIDFNNGRNINNYPPRIKSLSADNYLLLSGQEVNLYCTADDMDGNDLVYNWFVSGGEYTGSGSNIIWLAPQQTGEYSVTCIIDDNNGGLDTAVIYLSVVSSINNMPEIIGLTAVPRKVDLNSATTITCMASDIDNDILAYSWNSVSGIIDGSGKSINWTAPQIEGNYFITCLVSDGKGGAAIDSIEVMVRNFTNTQTGELILFLPFNGNANDDSGNNLNGTVSGASVTLDRFQNDNAAYIFDGVNDNIVVSNNSILNFSEAISVSFWMKIGEFYERESYPISHGNWETRWKISITNKRIRWTVKTNTGVKDLDSETELEKNKLYLVTTTYSGSDYELYINDRLDAFTSFSGNIAATNYDLTIGQVLPNNNQYNFSGVLDDIRIYNYQLPYGDVINLYDIPTSLDDDDEDAIPARNELIQNYPNPFNPSTTIQYRVSEIKFNEVGSQLVTLKVFDILGREVVTLVNEYKSQGNYDVEFHANSTDRQLPSGVYFYTIKVGDFSNTKKFVLMK